MIHVDFVETDGQPAAVGFELEVDAIKFEIDRNKLSRSLKLLGKEEIAQLKYQFVKKTNFSKILSYQTISTPFKENGYSSF